MVRRNRAKHVSQFFKFSHGLEIVLQMYTARRSAHANAADHTPTVNVLFTRTTRICAHCACMGATLTITCIRSFQCQAQCWHSNGLHCRMHEIGGDLRLSVALWFCAIMSVVHYFSQFIWIYFDGCARKIDLSALGSIRGTQASRIWLIIDSNRYGCDWITARNLIVLCAHTHTHM